MSPFVSVPESLRGFGANPARIVAALVASALVAAALSAPGAARATEGGLLQGIAEGSAAVAGGQAAAEAPEEAAPAEEAAPVETAPEEAAPVEETSPAPDAAADAAANAVQESGLSFELPEGVYFAEDEWWTYLDDVSALYFRTAANVSEGPDVALGAPDDAWGTAQTEEGYEYLGAVAYANGTVSFYSYFWHDLRSADNAYVDFKAYVPLSDGTTSCVYGFTRGDTDAMLGLIDAVLLTVEEGTGAAAGTASAADVACGSFTFVLPDDVAFELATAEDGSILGTFPGPEGTCEIMLFSFNTEGVTVTSVEELQQAGDAFMSGVEEGAAIEGGQLLDGSVFTNDQGIAYYQGCYISSEADALFVLLPYNGTMTVVAIFDSGSSDDFAYANETLFAIADSSSLAETPVATSGVPTEDGAAEVGGDIASALSGDEVQLV